MKSVNRVKAALVTGTKSTIHGTPNTAARTKSFLLVFLALASTAVLHADATFFVEEPYGPFGAMNPTGHAAIYLSRVCAATPVVLHRCGPGELGIVVSRYSRIAGYDWIAIPLIPYLYAVERPEDVPEKANAAEVALLRDAYRREHLTAIAPDGPEGTIPGGAWVELIGAAYNRKIYGFQFPTTPAQDDHLIAELNSRKNHSHFNLFFNNCADFSRKILNLYYPHAVHRSYVGDAGLTTPKQLAECLVKYAKSHPELHMSAFYLPQIPGSRDPSHHVNNVCEAFVKTKKYMVPLAAFHPWLAGGIFAAYLAGSHFNVAHYAETEYGPHDLPMQASLSAQAGMP